MQRAQVCYEAHACKVGKGLRQRHCVRHFGIMSP